MKQQILWMMMVVFGCMGCTHNNGDIGPWFGTWKLNAITINGDVDEAYAAQDNMVWKFQSSVVEMQEILPGHMTYDHFGTWHQLSDDVVEMKFIYKDDNNPVGSDYYSPPVSSHLPKGEFVMDILELASGKMRLRYTSDEGTVYTYSLKKW